MGKFGKIMKDAAKNVAVQIGAGTMDLAEDMMWSTALAAKENAIGDNDFSNRNLYDPLTNITSLPDTKDIVESSKIDDSDMRISHGGSQGVTLRTENENDTYSSRGHKYTNDYNSDVYKPRYPMWSYDDFINERNIWLKHLSNGLDESNWVYFKIFFDFNSTHGLLGGILDSSDLQSEGNASVGTNNRYVGKGGINTANLYLQQFINIDQNHLVEKLADRRTALVRFVQMLSNINTFSPWLFKSISELKNSASLNILEPTKEKTIHINLGVDTVDWRITTLLSLYKYACFDEMNMKEIIPENLRKFDMHVVIFSAPIKHIHTPVYDVNTGEWYRKYYKQIYSVTNPYQMMSTKIFSFLNCEIKPDSIGNYIPDSITNEEPAQLGGGTLEIMYDRSYEHHYNEFECILVGSNGIMSYDPSSNPQTTLSTLAKIRENINLGHVMQTMSEYYSVYQLNRTFGNSHNFILGNLYGDIYKSFINREDELPYLGNPYVQALTNRLKSKLMSTKLGKNFMNVTGKIDSVLNKAGEYLGINNTLRPSWMSWGIDPRNSQTKIFAGAPKSYSEKLTELLYGPQLPGKNKRITKQRATRGVRAGSTDNQQST